MKKFITGFNIGSASVSKVRDVFIIFWQSNAQGNGIVSELPVQDQGINEYCKMYNRHKNSLDSLNPGINSGGRAAGRFGLEQQFAKRYKQEKKKEFIILKFAIGSTFMSATANPDDWSSNETNESFDKLKSRITTLNTKLISSNIPFVWKGIIGMGGEQDATTEATANAHEAETLAFISAIRNLPEINNPDFPFIFGRVNGVDDASMAYRDTVRAAQANIAANSAYNHMIDTDSYPLSDVVHYNTEGQLQFGNDVFNVFNSNNYI